MKIIKQIFKLHSCNTDRPVGIAVSEIKSRKQNKMKSKFDLIYLLQSRFFEKSYDNSKKYALCRLQNLWIFQVSNEAKTKHSKTKTRKVKSKKIFLQRKHVADDEDDADKKEYMPPGDVFHDQCHRHREGHRSISWPTPTPIISWQSKLTIWHKNWHKNWQRWTGR